MSNAEDGDEPLEQDAEDEGTNYRGLALQIGDDLHDDDVEALKFISQDFISVAKMERMKNVQDLYVTWEKNNKFGKNNPWFLAECLAKIQRFDLLEELGIDEDVLDNRLKNGLSQISDYRKMLLYVAEDLDSEELHKMLYLLGDMKKKDKGKILTPMTLFSYLEQTKQITPGDVRKLKDMLKTIDRNDLVDTVCEYESSKGLVATNAQTDREERMDTSEQNLHQPPAPVNMPTGKQNPQTHKTIAEYPPDANVVRERHVGIAFEHSQSGLRAEVRPPPQPAAAAEASLRQPNPFEVTQDVFAQPLLINITHELSQELSEQTWTVFGYHLNVGPEILQQLSRQYPQLRDRTGRLLLYWLHTWKGGQEAAMATIINALHEVQIHHLAEQFSRIYPTQQGTSELHGASLSSRTTISGSSEHGNISVHSREAQFVEPQAEAQPEPQTEPPQLSVGEAVATVEALPQPPDVMPFYRMDRKPRGLCIIINNEKFNKEPGDTGARDMPNREGTKVDGENLLKTFTDLYFEVRLYDNVKSSDMVRLLVNVALTVDHGNYDCFVCCILSHGTQGYIYGTDGRLVSINDLTGPFKSVVCPTLAGKPKLFFIQACQGREKQPGQEIERDGATVETDGMPREVVPNEADFLLGYATVPGFVSYRSRSHGSWYITKLCEMLNKYGTRYDLLSVLVLVNNEVGRANAMMDGGRYKQSPAPLYTLRKKLMFR